MTTTFCDLKCCEDRHGQTQPDTGRQRQSQTDTNRDRQTETDRDRHRQRQADRDRQRQTQADTEPARTLVAFQTRFPFFLSQVYVEARFDCKFTVFTRLQASQLGSHFEVQKRR